MARWLPCMAGFLLFGARMEGQNPSYLGTRESLDYTGQTTKACPGLTGPFNIGGVLAGTLALAIPNTSVGCPAVTFGGTITVNHPAAVQATVSGTVVTPATTPAPGTLETAFQGSASVLSGANEEHNFFVDLAVTGGLASGETCAGGTPSRSESVTMLGSNVNMSANVRCSFPKLAIVSGTQVTVNGRLQEFRAQVLTRVTLDTGHNGSRCCGNRGGKYDVTFRTTYKFTLQRGDELNQSSSAGRIPVQNHVNDRYENAFVDTNQPGLDTGCRFGDQGNIQIGIPVRRYVGETNSDGTLRVPGVLAGFDIVTPFAKLKLAVFDVDDKAPVSGTRQPELDFITFNGTPILDVNGQDWLTGMDKQWTVDEFVVPIKLVKFPSAPGAFPDGPPQAAMNVLEIKVDSANRDQWCTEVDWAALSFGAMAPVMLVHGTNTQSSSWEVAVEAGGGPPAVEPLVAFQVRRVPYEYRINLVPNGSFWENAGLLEAALQKNAARFGTDKLHIVAHSKGGSDTRAMLSRKDGRLFLGDGITPLKILSLFALGTPSRGTVLSDLAVAADNNVVTLDPLVLGAALQAQAGAAATFYTLGYAALVPLDPARQIQTTDAMDGPGGFNSQVHKPAGTRYFSIAGDADRNGNQTIDTLEEAEQYSPGGVLLSADTVYQLLGRYHRIDYDALPTLGSGDDAAILHPVVTGTFEPNDLVSAMSSVHCTACGFETLNSYKLNHSQLKSKEVMYFIVDTIQKEFPLPPVP